MSGPAAIVRRECGCPSCTGSVNSLGDLSLLAERVTPFVLISRAPLAKLQAYKQQHGWKRPWGSSFGSDFNYDFHVTVDEKVAPVEYNYRPNVYDTYSAYARGVESLTDPTACWT